VRICKPRPENMFFRALVLRSSQHATENQKLSASTLSRWRKAARALSWITTWVRQFGRKNSTRRLPAVDQSRRFARGARSLDHGIIPTTLPPPNKAGMCQRHSVAAAQAVTPCHNSTFVRSCERKDLFHPAQYGQIYKEVLCTI
jgi:hypothetical protein